MSRNSHLEAENKRLSVKLEELKGISSLTSSLNVKYRLQLDKEATEKESFKEVNHRLKLKLNSLTSR